MDLVLALIESGDNGIQQFRIAAGPAVPEGELHHFVGGSFRGRSLSSGSLSRRGGGTAACAEPCYHDNAEQKS